MARPAKPVPRKQFVIRAGAAGGAPGRDTGINQEPVAFAPEPELEPGPQGNEGPNGNQGTGPRAEPEAAAPGYKTDGTPRGKPGRKPGTSSATASRLSVSGIDAAILSIHTMLAAITRIPELALDPAESRAVAQAIANVAQHYPNTVVDPKTLAWGNLAICLCGVYGTRAVVIGNNASKRKRKAPTPAPDNVTSFPMPGYGPGFTG